MTDPNALLAISAAGVAALGMASLAALKGWSGWLDLKREQLGSSGRETRSFPFPAARLEIADLKERIRKLEAIANGAE
jgi:hypothetical protein